MSPSSSEKPPGDALVPEPLMSMNQALERRAKTSLASKFSRVTLAILVTVGIATVATVTVLDYRAARISLQETEARIEESLKSKGRGLAQNHALALTGMVYDNAYTDVQELVLKAPAEDEDLVYGLYLAAEGDAWAYFSPSAPVVKEDVGAPRDPKLWKELKIASEKPPEAGLQFREVQLFGQRIFEFAMPIMDEDEALGTVRYGISTRRMEDSLAAARELSAQRIRKQFVILVGLGLLTTLLGIFLVRREAVRVTRPLEMLSTAANELASGNREVRVQVASGDEVELLAKSFNKMVEELRVSYEDLEALNRSLEERVAARTAELAARNRDMQEVFENVAQGFITLGPDGVMGMERSAVVDRWFGRYERGTTFWNYLEGSDGYFAENFELGWEALVDGFLPLKVALRQMPHKMTMGEQLFSIEYVPLKNPGDEEDDWRGILLVIADITEQTALQRVQAEQQELGKALSAVVNDRQGFVAFRNETARFIEGVVSGRMDDDLALLKRTIHTIKGNASIYGFQTIATCCHAMEDEVAERHAAPSPARKGELRERWRRLCDSLACVLGDETANALVSVGPNEYTQLLSELCALSDRALFDKAFQWQLSSVPTELERLAERTRQIASKLGKRGVEVEVVGDDLRADEEVWAPFWMQLIHVVRNAVDHGIKDLPDGAPARVSLGAFARNGHVEIEVRDNGVGIDWQRVREKARELGLASESRSDLIAALFADGLSTRREVSEYSGRGVGMAAVREQVSAMGGSIHVESELGEGTLYRFRFPESALAGELYAATVNAMHQASRAS